VARARAYCNPLQLAYRRDAPRPGSTPPGRGFRATAGDVFCWTVLWEVVACRTGALWPMLRLFLFPPVGCPGPIARGIFYEKKPRDR
jgi:hypothetical protein